MAIPAILRKFLSLPTAPFAEHAVLEHVQRCVEPLPNVRLTSDKYGNLLAHYRFDPGKKSALVFSAHCDHPGFVALEMVDRRTLRAAFRGWVEPEYFDRARVRFWDGGGWVGGRIVEVSKVAPVYRMIGRTARPEEVLVRIDQPVEAQQPGMWDLPDPFEHAGCVHARGCDDIAGCAAMVALLERLSRQRARCETYCLFTRAEEVGFVGAIGAAKAGTVPKRLRIVAIETSKALGNAVIGDGPILRVGDKTSIFTPEVTDYCQRVAQRLAEKRKSFRYQRRLMDGGTCESTAFVAYGYAATGICLALGNYHNMDTQRKKIAAEYVSIADWNGMVDWFEALAMDGASVTPRGASPLLAGLEERFAQWLPLLRGAQTQGRLRSRSRSSS